MRSTIGFACGVMLSAGVAYGQLRITAFDAAGHVGWTNSTGPATYRLEFSPIFGGPYSPVTNLIATGLTNSLEMGAVPGTGNGFWRIVWADASPARPVGNWEYRGFDPSGGLTVTGLVSIAASNPVSGSCTFQAAGANPRPRHPVGSGAFTDGVVLGSNGVQMPLPTGFFANNFRLSGQMTLDEYWGWWSWTDSRIGWPYGGSGGITISGWFSARRID